MRSDLYEKLTSPAGKVSYKLVAAEKPESPLPQGFSFDMTEGQIISAIGFLAVAAISGYQNLVPAHKLVFRKIQPVKDAVLEMYRGTGQHIDEEMIAFVAAAWDGTMRRLDGEGEHGTDKRNL